MCCLLDLKNKNNSKNIPDISLSNLIVPPKNLPAIQKCNTLKDVNKTFSQFAEKKGLFTFIAHVKNIYDLMG